MSAPRIRVTIETFENPVEDCCMTSVIQEEDHDRRLRYESVFARAIMRLQAPGDLTPWHFLAEILVELAELETPLSQDSEALAQAEEKLIEAADAVIEAWNESCRSPQAIAS